MSNYGWVCSRYTMRYKIERRNYGLVCSRYVLTYKIKGESTKNYNVRKQMRYNEVILAVELSP